MMMMMEDGTKKKLVCKNKRACIGRWRRKSDMQKILLHTNTYAMI